MTGVPSRAADWAALLAAVRGHQRGDRTGLPAQEALVLSMRLATASIPDVAGCSVTQLMDDGSYATTVTDGELALSLDLAQYEAGDGPCVTATRVGRRQLIDRMAAQVRWSAFGAAATQHGIGSSLSIPLQPGARRGAVNVYGAADEVFRQPRAYQVADLIARITGTLFATVGAETEGTQNDVTQTEPVGVGHDRSERDLVLSARDVIARHYGMSPAMAFRHLAVRTAEEERPMADIAREVVAGKDTAWAPHDPFGA